jgi:NAD(P)-dependent dehydrogenase (short-subunit alcohol dehydrogenase family)
VARKHPLPTRAPFTCACGPTRPADGAALQQAAREAAAPGEVTPLLLDVTDQAQIAAAAQAVTGHVGAAGLAGLVNNAGIGGFSPLELTGAVDLRRLLEVNVTGQLAVTQAFLPLLRRAQGRIVMVGSIGARFTPPFTGPLAASKSALTTPWPTGTHGGWPSWPPPCPPRCSTRSAAG